MIEVNSHLRIPDEELRFRFILASGPGGQNVNKVATAVQLRFDLAGTRALPEELRERLRALAGNRLTKEGELVITARRHRSQERNREEAIQRLVTLIRAAAELPKPRRRRRPSLAAKRRRLEEKRRRAEKKQDRNPVRLPPE